MSRASRYTIQGHEVTIPVEVRDASAHMASFLVPAAAAQDLIGYSGLEVAEPLPGRAVCSLAFMRYLDSDLGPYHEVAVAFLVRHKGMEPASSITKTAEVARGFLGAFIHQLPVNQEFTLEAGRSIWGFPKFLADIELDFAGPVARCELRHDGEFVLSLGIRPGIDAERLQIGPRHKGTVTPHLRQMKPDDGALLRVDDESIQPANGLGTRILTNRCRYVPIGVWITMQKPAQTTANQRQI